MYPGRERMRAGLRSRRSRFDSWRVHCVLYAGDGGPLPVEESRSTRCLGPSVQMEVDA